MAVNKYDSSIKGCYKGNSTVSAIYQGDTKIYPMHLYKATYLDESVYEETCNQERNLNVRDIPNLQDVVSLEIGCATRIYAQYTSTFNGTFSGFTNLESVTFENDELEYLYSTGTSMIYESLSFFDAFAGRNKLKSFKYPKRIDNLLTQYQNYRHFYNCSNVEEIDLTNLTDGDDEICQGFVRGCTKLKKIITRLGENVITFRYNNNTDETLATFSGCSSLPYLEIITTNGCIGQNAFNGCSSLQYLKFHETIPPTLSNTNAFTNTNNCIIYVPSDSVDAYKNASGWSSFADRIQPIV